VIVGARRLDRLRRNQKIVFSTREVRPTEPKMPDHGMPISMPTTRMDGLVSTAGLAVQVAPKQLATWTNTGFTRSAVNLLAIDSANPNIVYASTEGHYGDPKGFQGLFKSTDGGARWQPINKGLDSVIGSRVITSTALKIDVANSNILYLGTSNSGVFRSVDGGATWSALNDGLTNLQIRALEVARGGARTVYAATSGGVFKISDQ
jgi:hypothetical protein